MDSRPLFAAVADDDTGASDLAGMFADQGLPVLLVLDENCDVAGKGWCSGIGGVVYATAARALPSEQARVKTVAAFQRAAALNPRTYLLKYCSTFDSTEQGNIGPTIDATLAYLGERFTIALPALPVNGRTTYCGYHFVKGQLLSDSPMRRHPINPMTNSNLVDFLSRQTTRRVGLTGYPVVAQGAAAIRDHWRLLAESGIEIAIVDCLDDEHAASIAEAASDLRLITGGSAFGAHLPGVWRRQGWLRDVDQEPVPDRSSRGRGRLVVAGSCSVATKSQNRWLVERSRGVAAFQLDAIRVVSDGATGLESRMVESLARDETVLLLTESEAEAIHRSHAWAEARSMTAAQFGLELARIMAETVRRTTAEMEPRILIVAGGETASAVCRALAIPALRVGRNIEPGVPLCMPVAGPAMPIVLKSGNFGSESFYEKAFASA